MQINQNQPKKKNQIKNNQKKIKINQINQIYRDVGDASAFYCDVKGCGKK
jgi:hypothetical protein